MGTGGAIPDNNTTGISSRVTASGLRTVATDIVLNLKRVVCKLHGDEDAARYTHLAVRIIKGVGDRLGLDENKVISTVALHANTSAASIPLALDAAIQDGRIKKGDMVLLEAMGGGLTWGACALRL